MRSARGILVEDEALADFLRALPEVPNAPPAQLRQVLARAELHGLAGLVHEALRQVGVRVEGELAADISRRAMARDLDHAAHLALLDEIDAALAESDVPAAALKGALLAERLYAPTPSVRATSDVDILVAESDLDRAVSALGMVGYIPHAGPEEERYRREHHHLHLAHPRALPLELHFHAYRGFGRLIPGAPLVARRRIRIERGYRMLGVLSPSDELVYLAVHAAAHRFVRLGWLWDIKLLLERMEPEEVALAAERAHEWGYSRVLSFAAELLADLLGTSNESVAVLGSVGRVRSSVTRRIVVAPAWPPARAATRFLFTALLCDTTRAATSYATSTMLSRARSAVRYRARTART